MANTALNRTVAALLTNKSGGALAYGDVVILDNTNAKGFTTTTSGALSTRGIGVILEPNGIANNATGLVATAGWIPKINLNTAATVGQLLKTHTVAGQATPHSSPQVEGDFAVALQASATPEAILFGMANGPGGSGSGDVVGPSSATDNAIARYDSTTGKLIQDSAITIGDTGIITFPDNIRQTFNPGADAAGINVGSHAGNPGTPSNGDLWYNSSTEELMGRINGVSQSLGRIVQVVNTQTGAVATGTTTLPVDDTIPQNTEGDEYMTLAITPTHSSNVLHIDVVTFASSSVSGNWVTTALFQDTTADALAVGAWYHTVGTGVTPQAFRHRMVAGTTSATTFKVRIGAHSAGTVTFNGSGGARRFGGVYASSITITEILV